MSTVPTSPARQGSGVKAGILARAVQIGVMFLLIAGLLFGGAGTLDWFWGWLYVLIYVASVLVNAWFLRHSPELVAERGRPAGPMRAWDKVLGGLWAVAQFVALPLAAGLDLRFGGTGPVDVVWHVLGVGLVAAGLGLFGWAMVANAYFSTAARVQADRGQAVCREGPYRFVRHPGYAGAILQSVAAPPVNRAPTRALIARDRARAERLALLWERYPRAEPALLRAVSGLVPASALVYLGNSLPIREWDLAAERRPRGWTVGANRGANGIDGQLSTFFGMCGPDRENWAVVGDLTALYDLSAPWILPQLDAGPIRIVVVNNGGGQIFARLSPHAGLRNEHRHELSGWAALWEMTYHRWEVVPGAAPAGAHAVIELLPEREQTARFWRAYDALDERS